MTQKQNRSHVVAAHTDSTGKGNARLWVIPSIKSQFAGPAGAPTRLATPKLVAIAKDAVDTPRTNLFPDIKLPPECRINPLVPKYGEDLTFGKGAASVGHSVGETEKELKPKMEKLVSIFAKGDTSGVASRLFSRFLDHQSDVTFFQDQDLDKAVAAHPNAIDFATRALGAPIPASTGAHSVPTFAAFTPVNTAAISGQAKTKKRIHQALADAGWNIDRVTPVTDLGAPGFVSGSKARSTGDYDTGLGLLIGGVQWVYMVATHFTHDPLAAMYSMTLRFYFYDVFGLDKEDVTDTWNETWSIATPAVQGITAWWQLQHQFGYAPLVTRSVMERTFVAPATP